MNEDYANTLNNLGLLYYNTGEYQKSEVVFLKAKEIRELVLGKFHPNYATTISSLGLMYFTMGNIEEAQKKNMEALEIRISTLGYYHPSVALTLNNKGLICAFNGLYDEAEIAFTNAITIQKAVSDSFNIKLATYIDNLSFLYISQKKYDKALELTLQALEIKKELLGEKHQNYALSLCNLGKIYLGKGNYELSEQNFLKSTQILRDEMGENYINYPMNLVELASYYTTRKQYDVSDSLFIKSNKLFSDQIITARKYMSENELSFFIFFKMEDYFSIFSSYTLNRYTENKKLSLIMLNNSLMQKRFVLNSSLALKNSILLSKNPQLLELYENYITTNKLIAQQYSYPETKRTLNLDSLANFSIISEKKLVTASTEFDEFNKSNSIDFTKIKNSLSENEAAIEFVKFQYWNIAEATDTVYYCAFVIKKDYEEPEFVYLFEEKELEKILYQSDDIDDYNFIKNLYNAEKKENSKSDSLYKMVWRPLENYISDVENIYISPTGLLNKISFDAIPNSKTNLLCDNYNIVYLTRLSKIIDKNELYTKDLKDVAIFGNINYDTDTATLKLTAMKYDSGKENSMLADNSSVSTLLSSEVTSRGGVWSQLYGTEVEANNINDLFTANSIKSNVYTKDEASEEAFKSLSGNSPSVLHIATHGFYFTDEERESEIYEFMKDIQYVSSVNPLMRSGLVFAGGNKIWSGEKIPNGIDDGVLTAQDVLQLNFNDTKLVVLSACQTALGENFWKEGVYGLQRAFKMAGVDYMIVSLWKVPDLTTQMLMEEFYKNWLSGMEIKQAFKAAQNTLKAKYSAFGWAAFVLIE